MLDVKDLVEGVTKVKILYLPSFVHQIVGDVGTFIKEHKRDELNIGVTFGDLQVGGGDQGLYWFDSKALEIVENIQKEVTNQSSDMSSQSEDPVIYKSRWDEIIENLEDGFDMSYEELDIVKSVLKNNTPFNVVPDLKVIDPVIEKEDQTHLDANYVGVQGNPCFYCRSDILKQWFCWNEDSEWVECDWDYSDVMDVLPVSFGEGN